MCYKSLFLYFWTLTWGAGGSNAFVQCICTNSSSVSTEPSPRSGVDQSWSLVTSQLDYCYALGNCVWQNVAIMGMPWYTYVTLLLRAVQDVDYHDMGLFICEIICLPNNSVYPTGFDRAGKLLVSSLRQCYLIGFKKHVFSVITPAL